MKWSKAFGKDGASASDDNKLRLLIVGLNEETFKQQL